MNTEQVTPIEKALKEYANEGCDWDNKQRLIDNAYRYANVQEPTHLHCLAYALAKKLEQHGIAPVSKTEIAENESLHNKNIALIEALAKHEAARLKAKEYVPMTDDEIREEWLDDEILFYQYAEWLKAFEKAIIQRAGLVIKGGGQ